MVRIAVVILKLPDGKVVFQRRDQGARISSGLLGYFGGQIEPDEIPDDAIKRELGEETSLDISKLSMRFLGSFELSAQQTRAPEDRTFFLYETFIPDLNFKVREGERAEAYTKAEALSRGDLTVSAQYIIKNFVI